MNAQQLIDDVFSAGGRLWLVGDALRYKAPANVINPMLPLLKQHKQQVKQLLKLEPRSRTFRVVVDGKRLSYIAASEVTLAQAEKALGERFGVDRVSSVAPSAN